MRDRSVVRYLNSILHGGHHSTHEIIVSRFFRIDRPVLRIVLVVQVHGADLNANTANRVLFGNVTLVEQQHSVEVVLHNLLHTHERSSDRTVAREGFSASILNGNA